METLWGHRFKRPVTVEVISPDAKATVLDSFPMAVRRDAVVRKLWLAIGLYRQDQAEVVAAGRLRQTATRALFLPRSRRILLVPIPDENVLEEALAHEMIHAMQNEIFPLASMLREIRDEDGMVGFLGALEGQAEYLAPRLTRTGESRKNCQIPSGSLWLLSEAIRSTEQFRDLPPALMLPSYAPYVFGWQLACQVAQRHGIHGLDTLLRRPPAGSWQLWNPESYLAGELPVDWDTSWAQLHLPKQWSKLGQARIGEVRLASLLLEWDRELAWSLLSDAGLGWQGDRLWVVRRKGDQQEGIVWKLSFATPKFASSFGRAWWKIQGLRTGTDLPPIEMLTAGVRGQWSDPHGNSTTVVQEGAQVLCVQGFSEGLTRQILRRLAKLPQVQGKDAP
ncbi:MAG: hypothetical protein RL318_2468 [Fibrobacterota bacterium]